MAFNLNGFNFNQSVVDSQGRAESYFDSDFSSWIRIANKFFQYSKQKPHQNNLRTSFSFDSVGPEKQWRL
jgi:hypothetical protein